MKSIKYDIQKEITADIIAQIEEGKFLLAESSQRLPLNQGMNGLEVKGPKK